MDDMISRQAAIDAIMEEPSEVRYPVYYAEKIRQLPSSQRLVRCKDCAIRYTSCPMVVRSGVVRPVVTFFTEDDDYCSYGVAKGESDG